MSIISNTCLHRPLDPFRVNEDKKNLIILTLGCTRITLRYIYPVQSVICLISVVKRFDHAVFGKLK